MDGGITECSLGPILDGNGETTSISSSVSSSNRGRDSNSLPNISAVGSCEFPNEDGRFSGQCEGDVVVKSACLVGYVSTSLMYMDVMLGNHQTSKSLIDTGAQVSLVHESLLNQMGVKASVSSKPRLVAIGEKAEIDAVGYVELEFGIDSVEFGKIKFVVVPFACSMRTPVILGLDVLKKM